VAGREEELVEVGVADPDIRQIAVEFVGLGGGDNDFFDGFKLGFDKTFRSEAGFGIKLRDSVSFPPVPDSRSSRRIWKWPHYLFSLFHYKPTP